jgi:glutamyl-tRNA synthetase/glutamyl-Q tRNA(Asp) synthetase
MSRLDLTGIRHVRGPLVTRFAPSPTGHLHLGHVVNAIAVWGIAQVVGARVLLRIEDHDQSRCRERFVTAILEDLDWLGFAVDEGRQPLVRQRDRSSLYAEALAALEATAAVYPCRCSRRDIGGERYPGTCRHLGVPATETAARRVVMPSTTESFDDLLVGPQVQSPTDAFGDLLVRDRLDQWTYQFAVTVDDMAQGVTLIVRGTDLLASTGRQFQLARLLGRPDVPAVAHHPLILTASGRKLSKAAGDTSIGDLRRSGLSPARVIGRAAALAGLTRTESDVPATAVGVFWDRI